MNQSKRRALVFLISALFRGKTIELMDTRTLEMIRMVARIDKRYFDIFDLDWACCLTGEKMGNECTLYDFQDDDLINLEFSGKAFNGYDFKSESFYEGYVRDDLLVFNDSEYDEHFEYRILHSRVADVSEK